MQSSRVASALLLILIGLFWCTAAQEDPYRLPPNYIINHYTINLTVPAESFTASSSNYSGYVQIQFQVTVQTSEVKLHSSYNNIELLTIQLDDAAVLSNTSYFVNSTTNILTIDFPSNLTVGVNYTLKISFNAKLLGGGGFYKVSYTDHNNETQYIATTQFQATSARNAFPCFDEPVYKATFAYNLTYPSDMNALTNTPSLRNTTNLTTNLTTTEFDTSPRMSVYLVAFTISKYTCTEGPLEGSADYKHRVCSRLDKEDARAWAINVTSGIIDQLISYTGFNYTTSLSKLDQVAVPGKSGAMENWGLVIYGESALLFNNTLQTNANKQSIAAIIAHELAHMWFGNLLTCKWWSETFLNEGFASLFQYYITGYILPEYEMEKQFVIRMIQPILTNDGYPNVPALRSNASTPSQISSKFGSYTYYKGASVLRMIEHIVGREYFKAGIQKYMTDNAYQSVEPQDLWDAIENVTENAITNLPASANLTEVVDNWINKGGYPVVNVSLVGTNITISQQRFLYSGTDTENSTWYIPISYSTSSIADYNENTSPRGWVTPTQNLVITGFSNASDWIIVNNQQTGFYRVNYDAKLWENLAVALKQSNFSGIHVSNRAQVVQDSYMLARAGLLTFGQVMRNVEFLANDTSYFTWYPAVSLFWYLLQRTGSTTTLGAALTNNFVGLLTAATETVPLTTVAEENQIFTLNQVLINTYSCKFGNTVCTSAAKTLFATYKSSFERPNINTRSIVYCNAIRYSDNPVDDWNFLYQQYQNSSVSVDSSTIWTALGCATNTTVLNSFLSKILNNDGVVTSSLYSSVFSTIYNANEIGVDTALEFFINNYRAIIDIYNSTGLNVGSVLTGLGSVFTKTSQIEKLENFINSTQDLSTSIIGYANSALSTARSNQEIINAHKTGLYAYFGLADETTSTTSTTTTRTTSSASTTASSSTANPGSGATTLGKCSLVTIILITLISSMLTHNRFWVSKN